MKRLAFPVIALGWILAVWSYWRHAVASVPDAVLTFDRPVQVGRATARNEFLILRESTERGGKRQPLYDSELIFCKPSEGRITRRYRAEGAISGGYVLMGEKLIAIRESSRLRLIDADTLADVDELGPEVSVVQSAIPERGYVWYQNAEKRLIVRDVHERRDVWSGPICESAFAGWPYFIVAVIARAHHDGGQRFPLRSEVLNAATGERVTRFDHLGTIESIRTQANSPYAIVAVDSRSAPSVCRVDTGEELFQLPCHGVFSVDGQSISLHQTDANGDPIFGRWSEAEGCSPLPDTSRSAGGSWSWSWDSALVSERSQLDWKVIEWLNRAGMFEFLGNWIDLVNWQPPKWTKSRIVDVASGRTAVNLGGAESLSVYSLPDNSGVLISSGQTLTYYSNPATPNWTWLAKWSVAPPVVVALVWSGLKRVLRRRGVTDTDNPEAAGGLK